MFLTAGGVFIFFFLSFFFVVTQKHFSEVGKCVMERI